MGDRSVRDEEDVALYVAGGVPDLILQRAFKNIDRLPSWIGMLRRDISGVEVDAYLDGLASGSVEIVVLQVGSSISRLLGPSPARCDDQESAT